MISLSL
ncbi:hypothetical protein ECPA28_3583, partial [Escherichia coli PA28]